MRGAAYFIQRRGDECSIVKLHPDGREEILEHGLTSVDAETLYFICIGDTPVRNEGSASAGAGADETRATYPRNRQLAFRF
jgi:hypothetical protein